MAATRALVPPTISNILAMAAPAWGNGDYTEQEIAYVLNAAFTGFSAARRESKRFAGASSRAVIHTGFWGCGAFGGNRSLMTILQAMAGDLAGVDIEFWAFDQAGSSNFPRRLPTLPATAGRHRIRFSDPGRTSAAQISMGRIGWQLMIFQNQTAGSGVDPLRSTTAGRVLGP